MIGCHAANSTRRGRDREGKKRGEAPPCCRNFARGHGNSRREQRQLIIFFPFRLRHRCRACACQSVGAMMVPSSRQFIFSFFFSSQISFNPTLERPEANEQTNKTQNRTHVCSFYPLCLLYWLSLTCSIHKHSHTTKLQRIKLGGIFKTYEQDRT